MLCMLHMLSTVPPEGSTLQVECGTQFVGENTEGEDLWVCCQLEANAKRPFLW